MPLKYRIPEYIFFLVLLAGCTEKRPPRIIERSFYYWKSAFNLNEREQSTLNNLHVNRLYVKFFDIEWNEAKSEPMPVAIIKFPKQSLQLSYSFIPTVFITNDCMQKLKDEHVKEIAEKILLLINTVAATNNIRNIPEIQLDCDWNAGTKDKYFLLLQTIKNRVNSEKKLLSATIRLHQYKYYAKLGIPPADRGLLMCYNMGNLKNPDTKNSILEPGELKRYMNGPAIYPLPLDIALPLFSWKVLFRDNKFAGLIREISADSLKKNALIKQSDNKYEILKNSNTDGYTFQTGDKLRDEAVTFNDLIKAEEILTQKLKTERFTVVLYHLDSITLSKFSTNELETIFDYLH